MMTEKVLDNYKKKTNSPYTTWSEALLVAILVYVVMMPILGYVFYDSFIGVYNWMYMITEVFILDVSLSELTEGYWIAVVICMLCNTAAISVIILLITRRAILALIVQVVLIIIDKIYLWEHRLELFFPSTWIEGPKPGTIVRVIIQFLVLTLLYICYRREQKRKNR